MKITTERNRILIQFRIGKKRENMPVYDINIDLLALLFGIMVTALIIAYFA